MSNTNDHIDTILRYTDGMDTSKAAEEAAKRVPEFAELTQRLGVDPEVAIRLIRGLSE